MSNSYSVSFLNNSPHTGTACLYQRSDQMNADIMPLAWFTRSTPPQNLARFDWRTDDINFFWAETKDLKPGTVVNPRQTAFTNRIYANSITLSGAAADKLGFGTWESGAQYETLDIRVAAGVPPNTASVGITMSGAPVFAVQAQPNSRNTFILDRYSINYWLAFGDFQGGEVLDVSRIILQTEIRFWGGTNAMDVELSGGFSFSVRERRW